MPDSLNYPCTIDNVENLKSQLLSVTEAYLTFEESRKEVLFPHPRMRTTHYNITYDEWYTYFKVLEDSPLGGLLVELLKPNFSEYPVSLSLLDFIQSNFITSGYCGSYNTHITSLTISIKQSKYLDYLLGTYTITELIFCFKQLFDFLYSYLKSKESKNVF